MTTSLLFVYGSLKRGFTNPYAIQLQHEAHFLSEGRLEGILLNLGPYPAVVAQPKANTWVSGEVYDLGAKQAELLKSMDTYEGFLPAQPADSEYRREIVQISTPQSNLNCWCYVYNWNWEQIPIVESGIWPLDNA